MNTLLVVVEDTIREVLYEFLSVQGHTVFDCNNGATALDYINVTTNPVDLILSDMNMPVLNGVELAQSIRNQGMDTPIILITGYCTIEFASIAQKLNASIFYKPINLSALEVFINSI